MAENSQPAIHHSCREMKAASWSLPFVDRYAPAAGAAVDGVVTAQLHTGQYHAESSAGRGLIPDAHPCYQKTQGSAVAVVAVCG